MAQQQQFEWFADDQVPTRVLSLIREAEEYVLLVSPYVKPWGHLRQALELAAKKPVTVTAVVRKDPDGKIGGTKGMDAVQWLLDLEAEVQTVAGLHSKIYLNEKSVIVSSMNLLTSSSQGSHEFAIAVPPGPMAEEVREYVKGTLIGLAEPLEVKKATKPRPRRQASSPRPKQEQKDPTLGGRISGFLGGLLKDAACIRCQKAIDYDLDRPFCDDCYASWSKYRNEEYQEKHCHRCGKNRKTSHARPLCRTCYAEA